MNNTSDRMSAEPLSPSWYTYYTLRLYDTLKSCPYRPYLHVTPLTDIQKPILCLTYSTKPPTTYTMTPTCIQNGHKLGPSIVQRVHEAIYEVASQTTNESRIIQFEGDTKIHVWKCEPLTTASDKHRFVSVCLQINKDNPPKSYALFRDAKQCREMNSYVTNKQLSQYYTCSTRPPLFVSNPRFANIPVDQWHTSLRMPSRMVYDQLYYTAGDWSDLWYHALYTSYMTMQRPHTQSQARLRPRVKEIMQHITKRYFDSTSPYKDLSPETTLNTLYYVFQKQQKGIFIRIRNNTLQTFLPFVRRNFTNDYYTKLHLPASLDATDKASLKKLQEYEDRLRTWDKLLRSSDPEEHATLKRSYVQTLESFLTLEYECAKRFSKHYIPTYKQDVLHKNPNRRQWLANNHFFNSSLYYDNPNVQHYHFLFDQLAKHRKNLPDVEFVYMPRDFPVLKASFQQRNTTVFHPFPDIQDTNKPWTTCSGGLMPILSHTGKEGYYDIPLPTVDDIESEAQMYFAQSCNDSYISESPTDKWTCWNDKTISKAVFRGSATGRGVDAIVNQRLKVMKLSKQYPHLLDVKLVTFNDKYKASPDGLRRINRQNIQQYVGSISKKNYMGADERKSYKYNLCLDGHTRADRFLNELCTGAVVILPTTDGHKLWVEPFLTPLSWDDIQQTVTISPTSVRKAGYTHITIAQLDTLPDLIQWLQTNDTICQHIVDNAKTWLFHTKKGHFMRASPKTSFLYDYVEGVVRSIAKQYGRTNYYLPLVQRIRHTSNAKTPSTRRSTSMVGDSKSTKRLSKSIVGIVVGFRDTEPNGIRTQQLRQFCEYWQVLAPNEFHYIIVIAKQANVTADKTSFDDWWARYVGPEYGTDICLHDYIELMETHKEKSTLPHCMVRNLELVHNDCWLACGVGKRTKMEHAKNTKWSHAECYRRTGEQKFNLGLLKNAGFTYLNTKYADKLSHVIFTDIDMLPDHQLAPYYAQTPRKNEVIALATRGTVYDKFTIDDMPTYTLMSNPSQCSTNIRSHTNKSAGGKRRNRRHNTNATRRRGLSMGANKHRCHVFSPKNIKGKPFFNNWVRFKFNRFMGAAISFSKSLFETINGYPNSFWGWGGEDDELNNRFHWVEKHKRCPKVRFTIPSQGRLIDLEMGEPVSNKDKLAYRVKELQKIEKLQKSLCTWENDGLLQLHNVCKMKTEGTFESFSRTLILQVTM